MLIVGREASGYLVRCGGGNPCHEFKVVKLEGKITCPHCQASSSAVDLAEDFMVLRRGRNVGRAVVLAARGYQAEPAAANDEPRQGRRLSAGA